ncbi:MAG TPA: energy transducer TonB [Thermoanaerobaculia bacterium]|nr:energy transducer TonB [Thermoanaerobaculia bacterium]
MFEKSASWRRITKPRPQLLKAHLGHNPQLLEERPEESTRGLVIAILGALAFHVVLFLIQLPKAEPLPMVEGPQRSVYVVKPVRFRPPPKPSQPQQPRKVQEKRRVIPMPDPTPHDPEPEPVDEIALTEDEILNLVPGVVPSDAPAALGPPGEQPLEVGGNVSAPKKIYAPTPLYTEEARQGRIQGVVLLHAVIDAEGNVASIDVLKGLPLGLAESAVETVKTWRYEPARRDGVPVPVYFTLTVSFSLQ